MLDVLQSPEVSEVITSELARTSAEPIAKAMNVDVNTIFDSDTGRIFPMDTTVGTLAEVGTYLAGGIGVYKNLPDLFIKSKAWRNNFLKGTGSGAIIDQLLTNPDENISNVIEHALGEEAAREWNTYLFLSADREDSESMKRLKLLGEGALIGGLIDVVGGANKFRKLVRDKFNKTPQELSKEDKGELFVDFLEEQKKSITETKDGSVGEWKEPYLRRTDEESLEDAAALRNLREEPELRFNETPEGIEQVRLQQSNILRRWFNSTLTSRGYWSPRAFDAFNDSIYAGRATVQEAEIAAAKLNRIINTFSEENPGLRDKVNKAFSESLDDSSSPFLTQVENIARNHDLPEEVAEQVLEGRILIDQLSDRLSNSAMVKPELKEIIQDNIGSYIRRSFRLFEDKNYVPTQEIKDDAINFLTQNRMNAGELPELAEQNARLHVNEILERGDNSALEYLTSVKKLNNKIFDAKKDIPEEIRKLMGEVTDADESLLITVNKVTKFYEDARFHENLLRLGEGNYIFKSRNPDWGTSATPGRSLVPSVESRATFQKDTGEQLFDTDVYNTKIGGTGGMLDGEGEFIYYTTPEIASALKHDQGSFDANLYGWYKGYLSLKGFSQKQKTVYSITTQARNIIGGAQFGPANGIMVNPAGASVRNTFKTLWNNARDQGDEGFNKMYEEYLRLGVVNTNTNVNEFRALLESGFKDADKSILEASNDTLKSYGTTRKVGEALDPVVEGIGKVVDPLAKGMEKSYVAVDDFYKIVIYNSELETLQKALPTTDISVLKAEAARKVRATVPNYDFVPPYVKRLRQLPLGSFVSFPAESLRTSVNIYREAFKEMGSSNQVLKNRGMRRFAGRTAQMGLWSGVASGSAALYGFSREQYNAIQTVDEKPWSKSSPRIPIVIDGEIHVIDTQFLNAYESINAPFQILFEEVRTGKLKGEDLDERIIKGTLAAIGDVLAPYTDQPVLTQALTDVGYAIYSSDGRTPRGENIFNDASTSIERLDNAIWHIFQSFLPGTVPSIDDLISSESILATPNPSTGYVKPTSQALAATFAGLRINKLDPQTTLGYRVSEYNGKQNDLGRPIINYENTPEEIIEDYVNFEDARYRNTQELYRQFLATKELIGGGETVKVLAERGMSMQSIASLFSGKYFTPYNIVTETSMMNMFNKTPFDPESEINSVNKLIRALNNKRVEMLGTNLYFEEEPPVETGAVEQQEQEGTAFRDFKLAKGGEVHNVPQVPVEPDQRIDKMTGLPYDEQAGGAFIDEEDRNKMLEEKFGSLYNSVYGAS